MKDRYYNSNKIYELALRIKAVFPAFPADDFIAGVIYGTWPAELADTRQWYLNWHKERITNGLPYVFIDYDKVLDSLPPLKE